MLGKGDKKNYEQILDAAKHGRLAVMECKRVSDGKKTAVLCAVNDCGEEVEFVPFAELVRGDPYQMFAPPDPTAKDGFIMPEPVKAKAVRKRKS